MVDFLVIGGGTITNSIFSMFRDKKIKYGYSISQDTGILKYQMIMNSMVQYVRRREVRDILL